MKKVGILGGTFNPIHNGHIKLAKCAKEQFDLDEIWFMPNGNPPHKTIKSDISRKARYEMTQLAISNCQGFFIENFELERATDSYLYFTLENLAEKYPDNKFYFIIGEDSLALFDSWVFPDRIAKCADLIVAVRNDSGDLSQLNSLAELVSKKYCFDIKLMEFENMPISSSKIRESIDAGNYDKAKSELSNDVYKYILEHHLYRNNYSKDIIKDISARLEKKLNSHRYTHTLGVMYTMASLANVYGYNELDAMLAGLLHDCAKHMSNEKLLDYSKKHKLKVTDAQLKAPHLLHASVGAYLAQNKYLIDDDDILHAISVHTTGCLNMNLLDKMLFVADYIEPNRLEAPRLTDLRNLAFTDLDLCVALILKDTVDYLNNKKQYIDSTTLDTANYYLKLIEER